MHEPLQITSEIGKLKTVILHRPGKEVENLTPELLERLLFDDIPFLPTIEKEHDYFADVLRANGVTVLYLEKLMEETLQDVHIRQQFVEQLLIESRQHVSYSLALLKEYLLDGTPKDLVKKVMSGVSKKDVAFRKNNHLHERMTDYYPFYLDPMPNLYFTRDPAAVIGKGISINRMSEPARMRESIFMDFITRFHPSFRKQEIPRWSNRNSIYPIEGGDQLLLNKHTVAVGVSARSTAQAIENMAVQLFSKQEEINKVIAIEIPKSRAFMHLDTVFTMVDHEKFTIHPAIQGPSGNMRIFILEPSDKKDEINITEKNNLLEVLKETLNLKHIDLIPCGGGDPIASAREQWNDGSNTLAIAPGVVITYDRNYVSNKLLREHGMEVIEIPSSELSRGRGGPRCMSMPVYREKL